MVPNLLFKPPLSGSGRADWRGMSLPETASPANLRWGQRGALRERAALQTEVEHSTTTPSVPCRHQLLGLQRGARPFDTLPSPTRSPSNACGIPPQVMMMSAIS